MTVQMAIQWGFWIVGIPLEILVISSLLGRAGRRFPLLLVYNVAMLLATVIEIAARTSVSIGRQFKNYYWIDYAVLELLLFLAVISLVYQATERQPNRDTTRRYLIAGLILITAVSWFAHAGPKLNEHMTLVVRDLNFASAILDLILWSALIRQRNRERTLLLISGGLGLQFTGEAIGQSLRQLALRQRSTPIAIGGNCVLIVANMLCLYVWWQAFRQYNAATAAPEKEKAGIAERSPLS